MVKTTAGCINCADVWVEDGEIERETCPECGSDEFYTARHGGPKGIEEQVGGLFRMTEEPVRRAADAVVEPLEEGYELVVSCPGCDRRISWTVEDLDEEVEVVCPGCESVYRTQLRAGDTLRQDIMDASSGNSRGFSWWAELKDLFPWN